jgi:hypothetical protein
VVEAFTDDDVEGLSELVSYLHRHSDLAQLAKSALNAVDDTLKQLLGALLVGEDDLGRAMQELNDAGVVVAPVTALLLLSAAEGCPKVSACSGLVALVSNAWLRCAVGCLSMSVRLYVLLRIMSACEALKV